MSKFYTSANVVGDNIHLRYIDDDGNDCYNKVDFQPTLFTYTENTTGYTDIYGKSCLPRNFDSIREMRSYFKENKDIGLEVLGMEDPVLQFLSDKFEGTLEFKRNNINIYNLDIEVNADIMPSPMNPIWPIDQICVRDKRRDRYVSFSLYEWDADKSHERVQDIKHLVDHRQFDTEKDLLKAFVGWWRENPPHIITGWNVDQFDISYMCARLEKLFSENAYKRLSPFGRVNKRSYRDDFGNDQIGFSIDGVEVLDYLQLYKKFELSPRPNYKLDTIGEIETGQKKLQYDGKLRDLAKENPQLYIDYNIIDTRLVEQIDDKKNMIELAMFVAFHAKVNPSSIFSPVKVWDATIFNALKAQKKVIPMNRRGEEHSFEGGYVKEPQKKLNGWVMSFDFTSLYPSIIRQCNISPETLIHYDENSPDVDVWVRKEAKPKYPELSACPNGAYYRKDVRGVVAEEIEKVFFDRKASKKKAGEYKQKAKDVTGNDKSKLLTRAGMFSVREQALKVLINSLKCMGRGLVTAH